MDPTAQALLQLVPYLRRYARALAGGVGAGDALVAEALKRVTARTRPDLDRHRLYAELHRLHDDAVASGRLPPATERPGPHPIEAALARLPERHRRLFLLVSLEELGLAEAGAVLDMAPEAVQTTMTEAQEALRDAMVASVMIVEDDAIIAFDLAETVRDMGHRVCGTATTMDAALATATACRPTLALMDLRLAHGDSGIVTAVRLRQASRLPIIFVTAFGDELARRWMEELGPVIRKPFTRDQIERAIARAVFTPTPERPPDADRAPANTGANTGAEPLAVSPLPAA